MFRRLYLGWKALRLPWRRDVLAGTDLAGNLYFERAVRGSRRNRRHVVYSRYIPVNEFTDSTIPVQWQAWMRHTRTSPPTVAELLAEIQRRECLAENVQRLAETEAAARLAIERPDRSKTTAGSFQKTTPGEGYMPEVWGAESTVTDRAASLPNAGQEESENDKDRKDRGK
ncbi:hypothetical protein H4217_001646 [Coemansia sp. RSA 1939]|nr:hypothetical protein H4217_001646 [Coemansia sp. RSA 1939]